jgi:hypothetical protein
MADELDDFLKQAALRRQQRQQQKGNRPPVNQPAPPPPPSSPIRSEAPRLRPESRPMQENIPVAEVVEYSQPYIPTIGNLSTSLPSASLDSEFKSAVVPTMDDRPKGKQKKNTQAKTNTLKETPATAAEPQPTAKVSAASLVTQLRDPQTLRMAIIAHEIMKRPWQ